MQPVVLGIDIGTTKTKACLLDAHGAVVRRAAVATPFERGEAQVGELIGAVEGCVAQLGPLRDVAGIGIAGLAESGAPFDERGAPLAPVIAWHDPRGEEIADELAARRGRSLERRIGRRLNPVSSIAKLGHLLRAGVTGVRVWLGVPELVLHHLTGARATDWSLASRTGAFDVPARRYIEDLLVELGFPPDVFIAPRAAGAVMGRVRPEVARRLGVGDGVPVTVAGHDHLVGMAGAGATKLDMCNSVGTAETFLRRVDAVPDMDACIDRRLMVSVAPDGDGWVVFGSAGNPGLVLDTVLAALGESDPARLDGLAAAAPTAVDVGSLIDDVRAGRRAAIPDGAPGAVWRGTLEALAARGCDTARRAAEVAGASGAVVAFGGGSRSAPWLAAKAACLGAPLRRLVDPDAVSRGAAIYAGVAAGWWGAPHGAPPPSADPVGPARFVDREERIPPP